MALPWHFVCASDLHYTYDVNGTLRWNGGDHSLTYAQLKAQYDPDFVLCTGDLTQNANDGSGWCWINTHKYNELQAFITRYLNIVENFGMPVKLCLGNHDINRAQFPGNGVAKLVHDRHGATYSWLFPQYCGCYAFDHKGYKFICMGDAPRNFDWLEAELAGDVKKPTVIFFHQSMDPNNFDFWSDADRNTFHHTICDYNIQLLCTGHSHVSQTWPWRGIPSLISFNPVVVKVTDFNLEVNLYPL